jgi:hypothetical protein
LNIKYQKRCLDDGAQEVFLGDRNYLLSTMINEGVASSLGGVPSGESQ